MASQMEPSLSPESAQPDLFSQESPAFDIDKDLAAPDSEAPEISAPETAAPTSTEDVANIAQDAPAEAPVAAPSWSSLDDIQLEAFDETSRPHVSRVLNFARGHIEQRMVELAQSEADFKNAKTEFDALIQRLNQADTEEGGMEKLSHELQQTRTTINALSDENVHVAWRAFTAIHPEYEKTPVQMREAFANIVGEEGFHHKFRGKTLVDRLTDAYAFAAYTNGVDLTKLSNATPAPIIPNPNTDARRQSVIADGSIASARPVTSIDEQSWDEIRNRHDYLLDELR